MTKESPASQSAARKVTLTVLAVAVLVTVFVLPQLVTEPWVEGNLEDLPPIPEASPASVAPSTAAELKQYRQDSQKVLAEIVTLRDRLEQSAVERWAQADFEQAQARIEAGDNAYSYGEYRESLEQFRQALDLLTDIERRGQQTLQEAKAAAKEAIESLNLNLASSSFGLASAMAPEDPQVDVLRARVGTLPQVAALLEAGDQALERDRFQEAKKAYREAVDLDPAHQRANRSLAAASREVTEGDFRERMSRGFTAMENRDYEAARTAFRQAGSIRPGDPAVRKALEQVDNRESGDFVNTELEHAAELEAREEWRAAVNVYDTLLERDASLTDARVRLIPARVRADLDERLTGFIAEPLTLSSKAEHQAAATALQDAKGIANPGPRLSGQISELETLLKMAATPVSVVFQSDNQTHVILYRVADLGQFERKAVKLRPGKYIAAGTRSGYRDVLVEFTVTGDGQQPPIVVRCEEPIG